VEQAYSGGVLSETRHFFYSAAWQMLEERVGASSSAQRQSIWGLRYVDDIMLRDRDTDGNGSLDERLYGLQDPNWNVTALADVTDAIQERYVYPAYGVPTVLTPTFGSRLATLFDWEVLFAGYRWDAKSGLYQVRERYYEPPLGCWPSRDPLGFADGMNPYQYVASRPIIFVDSRGTQIDKPPVRPKCCSGKNCVWNGAWTVRAKGFIVGVISSTFHFVGTDDTGCVYVERGTGSATSEIGPLIGPGIGTFSVSFDVTDAPAVCEWPIKGGSGVEAVIIGAGGAAGVKASLSTAVGRAGVFEDFKWIDNLNAVGGINLFVINIYMLTEVSKLNRSITQP
jgi:RHS repeat-associated protein